MFQNYGSLVGVSTSNVPQTWQTKSVLQIQAVALKYKMDSIQFNIYFNFIKKYKYYTYELQQNIYNTNRHDIEETAKGQIGLKWPPLYMNLSYIHIRHTGTKKQNKQNMPQNSLSKSSVISSDKT